MAEKGVMFSEDSAKRIADVVREVEAYPQDLVKFRRRGHASGAGGDRKHFTVVKMDSTTIRVLAGSCFSIHSTGAGPGTRNRGPE